MRYRITHHTAYQYAIPAHEGFDQVLLRPVSDESQTCLDFSLTIDPPATIVSFEDYYGNPSTILVFPTCTTASRSKHAPMS